MKSDAIAPTRGDMEFEFTIRVVVDPATIAESVLRVSEPLSETIVRNEIVSNLESVGYVRSVNVERKAR